MYGASAQFATVIFNNSVNLIFGNFGVGNYGQYMRKVSLCVKPVVFCRLSQCVDGGAACAAVINASKQPVFLDDGNGPNRALGDVVIDL